MWTVLHARFRGGVVGPGYQNQPEGMRNRRTGPLTIRLGSIGARDAPGVAFTNEAPHETHTCPKVRVSLRRRDGQSYDYNDAEMVAMQAANRAIRRSRGVPWQGSQCGVSHDRLWRWKVRVSRVPCVTRSVRADQRGGE